MPVTFHISLAGVMVRKFQSHIRQRFPEVARWRSKTQLSCYMRAYLREDYLVILNLVAETPKSTGLSWAPTEEHGQQGGPDHMTDNLCALHAASSRRGKDSIATSSLCNPREPPAVSRILATSSGLRYSRSCKSFF